MLQINVNRANGQGVVCFPKEARLPKKTLNIVPVDLAVIIWEREVSSYILDRLRKWVISRQNNLKAAKRLDGRRAAAIDKLLLMIDNNMESSLKSVCAKVVRNMDFIKLLAPHRESKFFPLFSETIAPIVLWCAEFKEINQVK
ncbi:MULTISPECIES: hypothetical protein [Sphingobacterium]|uniref:hypothetical protein n=1 Tax=Sphingobacterium TaxID=28453 RepID=UPI00259AE98C|nr:MULTISPECIES: hypothetical protein [Sphingobacterium]